jgi:nucleotide-binding universal stress UspA family protein
MRLAQCVAIDCNPTIEPVSVTKLRLWSAPQTILVATNLSDELTILPPAITQARQSSARILLAHVVSTEHHVSRFHDSPLQRSTSRLSEARMLLDRIARQLRWVGITCEPVVLNGIPEVEISRLAMTRGVDRLIVTFEDNPDLTASRNRTFAERILPAMEIPVCVIGRRMSLSSPNGSHGKNVTLAVSLNSDCQAPLRFASRLAQETHANLKVLHIFDRKHPDLNTSVLNPVEVASQLPLETWREAGLMCPAEVTVRHGDPAEEILKHFSLGNEGPIVLCSSGIGSGERTWRYSVSYRVMAEARYPVFVLGKCALAAAVVMLPEKPSVVPNKQRLPMHRTVKG